MSTAVAPLEQPAEQPTFHRLNSPDRFQVGDHVIIRSKYVAEFGQKYPGLLRRSPFTVRAIGPERMTVDWVPSTIPIFAVTRVRSAIEIAMMKQPLMDHARFMEAAFQHELRVFLHRGEHFWNGPAVRLILGGVPSTTVEERKSVAARMSRLFNCRCSVDRIQGEGSITLVRPVVSDHRLSTIVEVA